MFSSLNSLGKVAVVVDDLAASKFYGFLLKHVFVNSYVLIKCVLGQWLFTDFVAFANTRKSPTKSDLHPRE